MPLFPPQLLREIATPESFRRGRTYVEEGAVENVSLSRAKSGGIAIVGRVYGSVLYNPSLVIAADESAVEWFDCDCPYSQGGACKHVVALGLVAARRSVVPEPSSPSTRASKLSAGDASLLDTLRAHAAQRGVHLDDAAAAKAAKQLEKLFVTHGAGSVVPARKPPQEYLLGRVEFSFSFDRAKDLIYAKAVANYGPLAYPIETGWPVKGEEDGTAVALRDWHEERAARIALEGEGFFNMGKGTFELPASDAFEFLRDGLSRLSENYTVLVDEAFQSLSTIRSAEVTSDWDFGESSGTDWLSFSVDWKCGDRELTPAEISGLASGYGKFIRAADGSFVEISNQDLVRRLAEIADVTGRQSVTRARAIELALLAGESAGVRLRETTDSIASFLRDAKDGKLIEEPTIPESIDAVLRPYQRESVAWALFLRKYRFGGVLADDMGLGKTLQALAIISTERTAGTPPSLVICPKTLISTWVAESKRFTPNLRVFAVDGNAAERKDVLAGAADADLLVTSYSLFQRDAKLYQKFPLHYAILDEAQYVKNSKTATALAVKTIKANHRLALTGTPLENGVHELWSLYDFLMPGLLGDQKSFKTTFERPIKEFGDNERLQTLKRRVKPFLLRRTKESVAPELPPRIEQNDWCELTEVQASLYAEVLASTRRDVFEAVEKKGFNRSRIEILAALTRLRQVCNHPALVDKRLSKGEDVSGKLAYALELLREAADGGHKVLLFSQFTSMLDLIRPQLDKMGIGHVTIEGKTKDRAAVVEQFRNDPTKQVFLLSLRAAGTGLTLTEADTVVLYDPWWNPMVERQAMDRAHRIGQTKSVNVHKLVTKGTIEEKVLALQEKKKAIFDAVVSDSAAGLKGLTWEDVQGLFA